jgi:hypothetical protein
MLVWKDWFENEFIENNEQPDTTQHIIIPINVHIFYWYTQLK